MKITFLGMLVRSDDQTVSVPIAKIQRALDLIHKILKKSSKKIMVNQLQKICGFLNFLRQMCIARKSLY